MFAVQASNSVGPTVLPAAGSFTVTIGPVVPGGPTVEKGTGAQIPMPSKTAQTSPNTLHSGGGAGAFMNAWLVDSARCNNTIPAITNSWHHNINFDDYQNNSVKDSIQLAPNESMTYEFTPTIIHAGGIFTTNGQYTIGGTPSVFMTLSTKPCDFDVTKVNLPRGSTNPCYSSGGGAGASLPYTVSATTDPNSCTLNPGQKYYFNIRWQDAGVFPTLDSCAALGAQKCGLDFQFR